jgi:hypothetical protein
MCTGRLVFSQLMDFLPMRQFHRCVNRYHGDHYMKSFSCLDQFRYMSFAQLSYRESWRDIESRLRAMKTSCTIWEFEPMFLGVLLPMQMKTETGAYMPTSLKC